MRLVKRQHQDSKATRSSTLCVLPSKVRWAMITMQREPRLGWRNCLNPAFSQGSEAVQRKGFLTRGECSGLNALELKPFELQAVHCDWKRKRKDKDLEEDRALFSCKEGTFWENLPGEGTPGAHEEMAQTKDSEVQDPGPRPLEGNGRKTAVPLLTLTSTARTVAPLTQDTLSMPSWQAFSTSTGQGLLKILPTLSNYGKRLRKFLVYKVEKRLYSRSVTKPPAWALP